MNETIVFKKCSSLYGKNHDLGRRCWGPRTLVKTPLLLLIIGLAVYLTACTASQSVQFQSKSDSGAVTVSGDLYRPEGNGPFPAVMVLHACGGVKPHDHDAASRLKEQGYVALVVDSFSSRGIRRCERGNIRNHVDDYIQDTVGALAFLGSLPFVDANRIAVMGFSLGGGVAIELSKKSKVTRSGSIRAAVAFYPARTGCRAWPDATVPVLFFYGESDNWTPPSECVTQAKKLREQGRSVSWKVYPGAYHRFDVPRYATRRVTSGGYILEYNSEAAADSWRRVLSFLEQHLR